MLRASTVALVVALAATPTVLAPQSPADTTRLALNRVFAQWSASDAPGCAAARPSCRATFVGGFLVSFTRNRSGQIDGMRLSGGRVRAVRFERVR